MVFTQIIANSLIIGSIYALVACSFSIIYSTNRFIHIAHGGIVTLGGYLLYSLYTKAGISFPIAVILSILLTGIAGVCLYALVYSPLLKRKSSNTVLLIASVGLLILIENILLAIFGAGIRSIGYFQISQGFEVFGAFITPIQIILIITSLVALTLSYFVMENTSLGRMMRAMADNKELASVIGLNVTKISYYSFFMGSIIGGISGILAGLERTIEPNAGVSLIVKGFTGAVIGGTTSVPGAILGGYLLGFAEQVGVWFIPSGYKDAIAFVILFLFLLLKPSGILGIERGIKA